MRVRYGGVPRAEEEDESERARRGRREPAELDLPHGESAIDEVFAPVEPPSCEAATPHEVEL